MNIINQETGEVTIMEIQSADINELAKALAMAQAVIEPARLDADNPFFKSSYATLDSIWQAARKPLTDNGLSVVQTLLPDNVLVTTLLHSSGQWLRSYLKLNPTKNDPQGVGSALTYGRRYSLAAIVGIAQADDDGDAGSTKDTRPIRSASTAKASPNGQPEPKPYKFPTKEALAFFNEVQSRTDNYYEPNGWQFMQTLKGLGKTGWSFLNDDESALQTLSDMCDHARQRRAEKASGGKVK